MEALIPAGKVQSSHVPRYKIIMTPKLLSTGGSEREGERKRERDRERERERDECQMDASSEFIRNVGVQTFVLMTDQSVLIVPVER